VAASHRPAIATRRVQDADQAYWHGFLAKRGAFIGDIMGRAVKSDWETGHRERILASLRAAYGRLTHITPDLCESYLRAWRADGTRWSYSNRTDTARKT